MIVNAMTRMRFCTPEGTMEFDAKGAEAAARLSALVRTAAERGGARSSSATGRRSASRSTARLAGLDSGCVWGGKLTALRLEDRTLYQVRCARLSGSEEE